MALCPDCKCEFTRLGAHWAISEDCEYPSFSEYEADIIKGVLMGDGWIREKDGRNPYFAVTMSSNEYLEFLDSSLGIHSIGVSHSRTADESAEMARSSGLNDSANSENYSELFTLRSRSNPNLSKFSDWYSSGRKIFPDEIQMSPTVLKHWYVCDGGLHRDDYIQIGISNESDNVDKIQSYFTQVGLPKPKINSYNNNCIAYWTVDESKDLFSYMGNSVIGFEYKWI